VPKHVVVFDYGSGNVHSAVKALEHAGASVTLTRDRKAALDAHGLVVPGVGAFAAVMDGLLAAGGDQIIDARLAGGKPVLGICVGLQVLCETGREHGVETPGLGQWPGVVDKLEAPRLPHMGWNTVEPAEGSVLFRGVEARAVLFRALLRPHEVGARRRRPLCRAAGDVDGARAKICLSGGERTAERDAVSPRKIRARRPAVAGQLGRIALGDGAVARRRENRSSISFLCPEGRLFHTSLEGFVSFFS